MAAAPDNAPVSQRESYLMCSICLEILQDPRTLTCFHSFCKCCLEKFVKGQREMAEEKVIEVFNCPECRTEFELKEGQQVADMTGNDFIGNMLEVLAIQRRTNQIPCNCCERKTPAVSRCVECKQYLCSDCLTVHGNWRPFKKHTVFTIDELVKPENQAKIKGKLRCKKHENKSLKIYCETCKELICTHCILREHQGHSCLSTEEIGDKKRELVKSSSVFLNDQLKEGNDLLQDIDRVTQELKNNVKIAKDEISQQRENILKAFTEKLEDKAELIMKEVDKKYNETFEFLVKQKDEVKVYLDKVKGSVDLTKNLLEKGTHEEILSLQNKIEENVKKVKNEQPTRMKPIHDGNIQYKANPVDNIDTTSNLDKMGEVVCHAAEDLHKLPVCTNSTILHDHDDYGKHVMTWLGDQFQWRLCYRASVHGWSAQNFHTMCDNKGPTVTIVKVGECIFGGYTDQNWQGNNYKQSNVSFLFSLKNKDNVPPFKAPVYKKHQHAICSNPSRGPSFGAGHDLHISNDSHINQQSYTKFGFTYQPPTGYICGTQQTNSLLAGSRNFTPTEIEVFF